MPPLFCRHCWRGLEICINAARPERKDLKLFSCKINHSVYHRETQTHGAAGDGMKIKCLFRNKGSTNSKNLLVLEQPDWCKQKKCRGEFESMKEIADKCNRYVIEEDEENNAKQ